MSAESPFSTRRCTTVLQAVENGERKTNLNKIEENLPRQGVPRRELASVGGSRVRMVFNIRLHFAMRKTRTE